MCGTDTAGGGALEPPPEGAARTKPYSTENSSSANRILGPRQKETHDQIPETKECFYIYVQVPTTQIAKMSIDPKFVELTADVLKIFSYRRGTITGCSRALRKKKTLGGAAHTTAAVVGRILRERMPSKSWFG